MSAKRILLADSHYYKNVLQSKNDLEKELRVFYMYQGYFTDSFFYKSTMKELKKMIDYSDNLLWEMREFDDLVSSFESGFDVPMTVIFQQIGVNRDTFYKKLKNHKSIRKEIDLISAKLVEYKN